MRNFLFIYDFINDYNYFSHTIIQNLYSHVINSCVAYAKNLKFINSSNLFYSIKISMDIKKVLLKEMHKKFNSIF